MHDVHSTGHPSLEVLEGRGWEALLQLVVQNLPIGKHNTPGFRSSKKKIMLCA